MVPDINICSCNISVARSTDRLRRRITKRRTGAAGFEIVVSWRWPRLPPALGRSITVSIKAAVEEYLASRPHKVGESVQFGWFVFRIATPGKPPRLETLDFRRMASFTEDFSEVERIHALQASMLGRFRAEELPCSLRQSALVSLSYHSGRADAFIMRQPPTCDNDSGWYVGVRDETRSLDDVRSFTRRSLYELTIHDMRMAGYWLLPEGTVVSLDNSA
jgi:hypothetical protein